jgi:hypothetical protein
MASTSETYSEGDPAFAHQSTLQTIARSIASDFGEDPVVYAHHHSSLTRAGSSSNQLDEEEWVGLRRDGKSDVESIRSFEEEESDAMSSSSGARYDV